MPTCLSALRSNKRHLKIKKSLETLFSLVIVKAVYNLTVASSEPVAKASPDGWNLTLFTSDSCPSKICTYWPLLISQTRATWSEAYSINFFYFSNQTKIIKKSSILQTEIYFQLLTAIYRYTSHLPDVLETFELAGLSRHPIIYTYYLHYR